MTLSPRPTLSSFEWELQNSQRRRSLPLRIAAFVAATALVWVGYSLWRPPLPMLKLRHVEQLGRDVPQVSITFDDAPHPLSTPLLLAALKRADTKATFFCVGENMRLYPELAHRIAAEGHAYGNHSQPHHNLTGVDPADYSQHIDAAFNQIAADYKEAGVQRNTTLFRPPGGGLNRAEMDYLLKRGYTLAWWSNNVGDWTCPPAWKIADGVKANLRAGDVILLHDGGTGTPQALLSVIKTIRRRGWEIVLMPEEHDEQ